MAITRVGTNTASTNGTSLPFQWDHTLVAGSNRVVAVMFGTENNGSLGTYTVTYGGETMTVAVVAKEGSGFQNDAVIAYILEADLPSNGSNQISITASGSVSTLEISGVCAQYAGVDQSAPATDSTNQTTPATIANTISAASGDLILSDIESGNTGSFTHGQSQSELQDYADTSSVQAATDLIATGSVSSVDSTFTGTLNRLARVAAVFEPAVVSPISIIQDASDTSPSDPSVVTITAPTAGDLIIVAVAVDKNFGTAQPDTGFTVAVESKSGDSSSGYIAYKISNGTETSVSSSAS